MKLFDIRTLFNFLFIFSWSSSKWVINIAVSLTAFILSAFKDPERKKEKIHTFMHKTLKNYLIINFAKFFKDNEQ